MRARLVRSAFCWLSATLAACGSAPRIAAVLPPAPPARAAPRPALVDATAPRADVAVRFNGLALRRAPFVLGLLALNDALGETLGRVRRSCGVDPLTAIDELVVSGRLDAPFPVVVARTQVTADAALNCAVALAGPAAKRTGDAALLGRDPAGLTVVAREDLLVLGPRADAEGALARLASAPGSPWPLAARIADQRDALAVVAGVAPPLAGLPIRDVLAVVDADETHFLVRLRGATDSPAAAADLVRLVEAWLDRGAHVGLAPELRASIHVDREGSDVVTEVGVRGDSKVQGDFLAATSALGLYAVRRYLAGAKIEDAKRTIDHLSGLVRDYADAHRAGPHHTPTFPFSAPRVPADVPAGKPVELAAADWDKPAWRALHFEKTGKQFYSFEIVRTADGRGAVVRATGDLDGNGVESRFERTVRATASGGLEIGDLGVVNEYE